MLNYLGLVCYKIETCMGTGIMGILRDVRGDGNKCCGTPAGMENILWESHGNV